MSECDLSVFEFLWCETLSKWNVTPCLGLDPRIMLRMVWLGWTKWSSFAESIQLWRVVIVRLLMYGGDSHLRLGSSNREGVLPARI